MGRALRHALFCTLFCSLSHIFHASFAAVSCEHENFLFDLFERQGRGTPAAVLRMEQAPPCMEFTHNLSF